MMSSERSRLHNFRDHEEYFDWVLAGFRRRAFCTKMEAQALFFAAICFTLASPLFVTLGDGWFFSKLVPSSLSVCAALATTWLQIRKPQKLWVLYRRAQRELEREKIACDFGLHDFETCNDRGKLLAQKVADIVFNIHERWEPLMPEPESVISKSTTPPASKFSSTD